MLAQELLKRERKHIKKINFSIMIMAPTSMNIELVEEILNITTEKSVEQSGNLLEYYDNS